MSEFIRMCSVCEGIEKDGKILPRGAPGNIREYNEGELTNGYLSKECSALGYFNKALSDLAEWEVGILRFDKNPDLPEKCPTLEEYLDSQENK
jgi:hypothetical protein